MSRDEEMKDFRQLMQEMVSSEEIENQEELTEVFESLVQDYSHLQKTKYLTRLPCFSREQLEQILRQYLENPVHAKFLQKKNVLLSAKLWRKIMLSPKKKLADNYKIEVENETKTIKLSQLSYAKINGKPRFLLRNIEIKLPNANQDDNETLISQMSQGLTSFIGTAEIDDIDCLEDLVNKCSQFGIHDYLLPEGYFDDKSLADAVLLFRYERVFQHENETDTNSAGHSNYGLPAFYQKVYPLTINQEELTQEAHFHFSEGVGAMSKLEDRSARRNRNNLGAGYALPISCLKQYLIKIQESDYESVEEKNFYLNNDFGMHFIYITKQRLELVLELMVSIDNTKRPFGELCMALKLMDCIICQKTNTKQRTHERDSKKHSRGKSLFKKKIDEKDLEEEEDFELNL